MLPHWTKNDVLVNGIQIHYTRTGQGEKPALVLAHGFADAGLCYLPVARDLEAEYDVILIDARGHGRSQRVAPGDNLDHAADLAGLIQVLGLKDPLVGGHSMGAGSSVTMEARQPGLARALILEDPGWRDWTPPPAADEGTEPPPNPWTDWLRTTPDLTLEQVMAKCRVDSPDWAEVEILPWAESKKQFDLNVLETGGTWMDWRDQARGITVPVLLLTADPEKGAIVTSESAAEAQALNPHIRVVNIPGAGHNIRRENYPAFMKAVREFLSEL